MILPVLVLITGGLIGSSPWWFTALTSKDLGVITELAGGAIKGAGSTPWLLKPLTRVLNLFVFGGTVLIGLRPPWDIRWLMLPILPFALIFWLTVLIHGVKAIFEKKDFNGFVVLALMGVVLAAGFIFSPYGDDPSGRYFLPLITPMAIFGAYLLISKLSGLKNLDMGVLLLVLIFNLGGTIQAARTVPPGITTQFDSIAQVDQRYMGELIQFLGDNQIESGYSNYWVAYPLSFLSKEELIFIPRLPYHEDFRYTARDDRYQPYQEIVESSRTPSYITTKHPSLNDYLRNEFREKGISWDEEEIGDFHIFYNLSEPIHVYQLGLGVTTSP